MPNQTANLDRAIEKDWQGVPATRTLTAPRYFLQSYSSISPWFGISLYHDFKTEHAKGSISEKNAGCQSRLLSKYIRCVHATEAHSIPEQNDPKFMAILPYPSRLLQLFQILFL
jgi:hypothetical protein